MPPIQNQVPSLTSYASQGLRASHIAQLNGSAACGTLAESRLNILLKRRSLAYKSLDGRSTHSKGGIDRLQ